MNYETLCAAAAELGYPVMTASYQHPVTLRRHISPVAVKRVCFGRNADTLLLCLIPGLYGTYCVPVSPQTFVEARKLTGQESGPPQRWYLCRDLRRLPTGWEDIS